MPGRFDHFRTHRQSRRLAGHDYAAAGWTFVTICTHDRRCFLGEVRGGIVGLSEAGCLAHTYWRAITEHAAHACLGAFVVMPNHVHGLLGLVAGSRRSAALAASRPRPGSVGAIVRSYKAAVTREARRREMPFAWQPRFHDRVVRSEQELTAIRAYIRNNPAAWGADRFRPPPTEASP